MGFQQTYKKVNEIKNIEASSSSEKNSGTGFLQYYEEVDRVVNIECAEEKNERVLLLCSLIEKMNESQTQEFVRQINSQVSSGDELSENYTSLWQRIKGKGNIKQSIIEYVKSGTAVISLVNSLLSLAKIAIGK